MQKHTDSPLSRRYLKPKMMTEVDFMPSRITSKSTMIISSEKEYRIKPLILTKGKFELRNHGLFPSPSHKTYEISSPKTTEIQQPDFGQLINNWLNETKVKRRPYHRELRRVFSFRQQLPINMMKNSTIF